MMKGLLIKDLKLMKNQKSFFVIMAFVGMIFLITWEKPYFAISYITMMFSMFAITSFSYDEFDNGAVYLFTLPFSRKTYVREKYLFGLLICLIALTVSTVLAISASVIKGQSVDLVTIGATGLSSITICVLFLSIAFPIEIKFGVEKGRIGFIVIMAVFFLGFYLVMKLTQDGELMGVLNLIRKVEQLSGTVIVLGLGIFWCVAGLTSMKISICFLERKEW